MGRKPDSERRKLLDRNHGLQWCSIRRDRRQPEALADAAVAGALCCRSYVIPHVMSQAELVSHFHVGTTNSANAKLYRTVYAAGSGSANNHQPGWSGSNGYDDRWDAGFANADHTHNFQTSATGTSSPMNQMQPYAVQPIAVRF